MGLRVVAVDDIISSYNSPKQALCWRRGGLFVQEGEIQNGGGGAAFSESRGRCAARPLAQSRYFLSAFIFSPDEPVVITVTGRSPILFTTAHDKCGRRCAARQRGEIINFLLAPFSSPVKRRDSSRLGRTNGSSGQ